MKPALLILLGAVGLVLLIALLECRRNLLLARASARAREVSVRRALGCSRGRLIRQFLTESMVLGVIGGRPDLRWPPGRYPRYRPRSRKTSTRSRSRRRPRGLRSDGPRRDPGAVGAHGNARDRAGLEISRSDLGAALRQSGGRGSTAAGMRTRAILVIAETALAVVLTIGAGLLVKSFVTLRQVDTGFRQEGLLTMELMLAPTKYRDGAQVTAFYQQLVERRARFRRAKRGSGGPSAMSGQEGRRRSRGRTGSARRARNPAGASSRGDGRLPSAMGVPFQGSRVHRGGRGGAARVAIVNELDAARYFDGADPIGKRIQYGGSAEWIEVVA